MPKNNGRTSTGIGTSNGKSRGKTNGSILNFFKKAEPALKPNGLGQGNGDNTDSLFLDGRLSPQGGFSRLRSPSPDDLYDDTTFDQSPFKFEPVSCDVEDSRFQENGASIKRRKFDSDPSAGDSSSTPDERNISEASGVNLGQAPSKDEACSPPPPDFQEANVNHTGNTTPPTIPLNKVPNIPNPTVSRSSQSVSHGGKRRIGPFIEDSDSEDDTMGLIEGSNGSKDPGLRVEQATIMGTHGEYQTKEGHQHGLETSSPPKILTLKQESTSVFGDDGFDGIEDFGDDEFPEEGEEYVERRWMEEQRRIEMSLEDEECDDFPEGLIKEDVTDDNMPAQAEEASSCPICSVSFAGITDSVSSHMHNKGADTILQYTESLSSCQSLSRW